ncbi:hypothetical protein Z949_2934 [Sulfitobacter guttiformis KCTC 32187]|nr:hypothetical protein Z949_2934 [Sulfitobacter guttiformis KCTC 32187]
MVASNIFWLLIDQYWIKTTLLLPVSPFASPATNETFQPFS